MQETIQNNIQNKSNGCYYLHTFYPANFVLPDNDVIWFEKDSIKFCAIILRHLKSLVTNDFGNKVIVTSEEERHSYSFQKKELGLSDKTLCVNIEDGGIYLLDHNKHLHQEFFTISHTEVIILFDTTIEIDNYKLASDALLFFIDSYRVVSNDAITLRPEKISMFSRIYKFYFHLYSEQEMSMTPEKRVVLTRDFFLSIDRFHAPYWPTQGVALKADPSIISSELKSYFRENKKPNQISEFVLKASEELHVHGNFKYSFLESWTGLEIAIVNFLKEKKIQKGVSKNKIESFETEIGISYLINIELQLVADVNDQRLKDLIAEMNKLRKLRNDVIHENEIVARENAEKAISVLGKFLNYIDYKPY